MTEELKCSPSPLTRRRFLGAAAGLGAMAAAPPMITRIRDRQEASRAERQLGPVVQASSRRVEAGELVVVTIQQGGGNDYLNTLAYLKDTGSDAHVGMNDDGTVNFLSHVGLGIAVHDGDATLLAEINAALEEMHANGTYDELYEKWLGVTQ